VPSGLTAILTAWRYNQSLTGIQRTVLLADALEAPLAGSSMELPDNSEMRTLEQVEREYIRTAFARYGGNIFATGKALGISRATLWKRPKQCGINSETGRLRA